MRHPERRHDADDLLIKLVAGILVLALGAWAYADATATKEVPAPIAERVSEPATVAAPASSIARPAYVPQQVSNPVASSINGKTLHLCVIAQSRSWQSEPCASPWIEEKSRIEESYRDRGPDPELVRQQAEARLAAEQARFAQLTGTGYAPARTRAGAVPRNDRELERARCANAKAAREQALEIAGIKRDYDFIRRLNEQVYEACKNT